MANEDTEGHSDFMPLETMMARGRRRFCVGHCSCCAFLVMSAVVLVSVYVMYSAVRLNKGQSTDTDHGNDHLVRWEDLTVVNVQESIEILRNSMQCRPKLTLEHIVAGPTDDVFDGGRFSLPQVLPVPRCLGRNSYCGDERGSITGFCCPSKTAMKTFEIYVVHGGSNKTLYTVQCEVHESCVCSRINCHKHENRSQLCENFTLKINDQEEVRRDQGKKSIK